MPPAPIWSPAWYGAPSALAWALVAATTVPVSSEMEPDWAITEGELSSVPSAASTGARARPDTPRPKPRPGRPRGGEGGRARPPPPLPVPGDQLKLSRIGPHVPAGQVGGGREAGPGRSAVLADLAEPQMDAAQAELGRGLPQRGAQAGGR